MGLRITDSETVAFYDSVAEWAFGPIFRSKEDAENFVHFVSELTGSGELRSIGEPRLRILANAYEVARIEREQKAFNTELEDDRTLDYEPFDRIRYE